MTTSPDRIGLAIMECQGLHYGHVNLLNYTRTVTKISIVGLGSVRKHGIYGHPFTFDQRKQMIVDLFGTDTFKFVPLDDIDSPLGNSAWTDYIIHKINGLGLPLPTDYFTGSEIDAKWYEDCFVPTNSLSASIVTTSNPIARIFERKSTGRRLHLLEREKSSIPSGRDIRFLIERRDDEWKHYIPERLHHTIEMTYPPHLRQAITAHRLPDPGAVPVGTLLILENESQILELKDDGQWRPQKKTDEKADIARRRHKEAR